MDQRLVSSKSTLCTLVERRGGPCSEFVTTKVPFVLLSQPTAIYENDKPAVSAMATNAHTRYSQIMADVEQLITDHIAHQRSGVPAASKLKMLVPCKWHRP